MEEKELAAVRQVLEQYIDATHRADVEKLKELFHPSALMAGYLGDDLVMGDPEPFFFDLESHPSMAETGAPYQADIEEIRVERRTAGARLRESGFFGAGNFVNFFQLLEVDGDWRIVSKTFESI